MDKIIISNLLAYTIIGIHPHERVKRQPVIINLELDTDISQAAKSDHIDDAVNYSKICDLIMAHVEASSDLLIEKLITDIGDLIFQEFPAVQKAKVRLDKPKALKYADSVAIEIERSRN